MHPSWSISLLLGPCFRHQGYKTATNNLLASSHPVTSPIQLGEMTQRKCDVSLNGITSITMTGAAGKKLGPWHARIHHGREWDAVRYCHSRYVSR